jgi:hypothetical protein
MRGGIITKADFNEIRRNQQALINQKNKTKPRWYNTWPEERKFSNIQVKETEGSEIDYWNHLKTHISIIVKIVQDLEYHF